MLCGEGRLRCEHYWLRSIACRRVVLASLAPSEVVVYVGRGCVCFWMARTKLSSLVGCLARGSYAAGRAQNQKRERAQLRNPNATFGVPGSCAGPREGGWVQAKWTACWCLLQGKQTNTLRGLRLQALLSSGSESPGLRRVPLVASLLRPHCSRRHDAVASSSQIITPAFFQRHYVAQAVLHH